MIRFALLLCLLAVPAVATPGHVQGNFSSLGGSGQITIAVILASTVTYGNTVTCEVINFNGGVDSPSSVTDDKSNTYTLDDASSNGADNITVTTYHLMNITNGPATITATWSANAAFPQILCDEWNGLGSATDGHNLNSQDAGSGTNTGPSVTTTVSGDLVVSMMAQGNNPAAGTAGSGWTLQTRDANSSDWIPASEDQVQSAAGAVSPTWEGITAIGTIFISAQAFKPSAAAASPPTRALAGVGK